MAGSVNKVILVGNIGKDPEVRSLQSGNRVCNLSIATSEVWRDKASGERKEKTEWTRVVIFNDNLITIAEKYLRKGSKVYVEGQLETRKWTDSQGVEKFSTEVVLKQYRGELQLLDSRKDSAPDAAGDYAPFGNSRVSAPDGRRPASPGDKAELDGEIPF